MALRLGDVAPDFSAPTTEGPIDFHQWLGNSWGVLFSHPGDYTPVCTTELGTVARAKGEFEKRNVKVIAVSVDPLESHQRWIQDINETQACSVNFPVIADENRQVAAAYDMIHPNANDTATVRSVFVIGPDKRIKLTVNYPDSTGRSFGEILRVIDSLQLTTNYRVATPADWQQGEDCIIAPAVPDTDAERLFPRGVRKLKPYLRYTPHPPINPNKALWEKGDFTRIAESMRESGEALVQAIGASAKDSSRVELPFAKIAPEKGTWWHSATTDGLTVPIGRAGAEGKQIFSVGQGTAVHALVAGRTGSGKSTLMHMLILSLGLTYPPDELELYMIDFKKGVEFKDYAPGDDGDWSLPHARVIAIESEREFGLSCLQGLDAELQRRGEIFRDAGCSQFSEYRQRSKIKLPRILLLVDEFHEFFSEDDPIARQASSLLDRLARQGRAFGMHMILGSQTLSAGHALPRSTMDQMAVRIALKCSEEDSRFIVGDNSAYALLTRQGEAIYNASGGLKEGNTRFQVAWLDEGDRKELLRSLHDLAQSRSISVVSPIVFEGNAAARLEENRSLQALLGAPGWPAPGRFVQAFLGQPVAIKDPTSAKFYRQAGRHLLVVGKEEAACVGIMASAVSSLMAQLTPASAEFYLLNMASADTTWAELPDVFAENFPHTVRALARRKVPEAIAEIATIVDIRLKEDTPRGPSIFVAGIGLHRVRELQQDDGGSWGKQEKASTPASQLAKILKDGPEVGVHVLGWWDSYSSLTRAVDRKSLREFGMRVALGMSGEDSSHLLDVPAAAKLGPHRAFFWDEDQVGQLEKFIPCGPPSENWLARAGEQLKRRARDPGANERP